MFKYAILGGLFFTILPVLSSANDAAPQLPVVPVKQEDNLGLSTESRFLSIFNKNQSSIVRVRGTYSSPGEDDTPKVSIQVGSGFFISPEGEVLTTATVAAEADRVWVEHKGARYPAKCCGTDIDTNVTVLKVLEPPKDFSWIPIPLDFTDPAIASSVFSISCPLECKPSPSQGWLLGIDGEYGAHFFPTYHFRVSLGNHPGEGGSPVFDNQGKLIGMVVYTATALNASYVLPVQSLLHVREGIRSQGHVQHGYVGMIMTTIETVGEPPKVIVLEVNLGSPAAEAGLHQGDELVSINGKVIHEMADVRQVAFFVYPGQFIPVEVRRKGSLKKLTIQVGHLPEDQNSPSSEEKTKEINA